MVIIRTVFGQVCEYLILGPLGQKVAGAVQAPPEASNPDPQKDLIIRSPRTIGEFISGLYRGYTGSI